MIKVKNPESIIQLLNIDNKKELIRYSKNAIIHSTDFVIIIWAAQAGHLPPYKYASRFLDRVPKDLQIKQGEMETFSVSLDEVKDGLLNDTAKKCLRKMRQFFLDRRYLAAHLFYTPCYKYWHLFYFDQRDQSTTDNHWKKGSHLHFINYLWANYEMEDVWSKILKGDTSFSSIHIRFPIE